MSPFTNVFAVLWSLPLNHISLGDKTNSDNASKDLDEDFVAKKVKWLSVRLRTKWFWVRVQLQGYFILNCLAMFERLRVFHSEIVRHENTFCISKYEAFILFLTETFVLYLCNFNITEKVSKFGTAFLQKCKYLQIFQF